MKTIKHHEHEYFHIRKRSFNLLWKIPLAIIPFILSYLNLVYGIIGNWSFLKLDYVFASDEVITTNVFQSCSLLIIPMLILEYILIAGSIIFLTYLIKGKLKFYDENGLIGRLIVGLITGLITGLIVGLIYGLVLGLIGGLIVGLINGLILGLILGLIFGLIEEFD